MSASNINTGVFRNVNILTELTAASGNQLIQIYTPGIAEVEGQAIGYSGFITSLRATVNIKSVAALVLPDTNPLDSQEKQRATQETAILASPKKCFSLYLQKGNENPILIGEILLFNRNPYYFVPLIRYLSDSTTFDCAFGTTISVQMKGIGYGLLEGNDRISIVGSSVEEAPYNAPVYYQVNQPGTDTDNLLPTQPPNNQLISFNNNSTIDNNSLVGN